MRHSIMFFLIIAAVLIVYSNSLGGGFIWDDNSFVINNDIIKSLRNFPLFFTRKEALAKGGLAGENYRPLVPLSYAVDYKLWQLNPMGYHIVNTFFHICNALMVFWLVSAILKDRYIALAASLFFALHPVQTEAVAWISGRSSALSLFFYLLSFCLYIKRDVFLSKAETVSAPHRKLYRGRYTFLFGRKTVSYWGRKASLMYLASLACFICALLSREMSATLPFLVILYDFYFEKKERISTRLFRYFPYLLVLEIYVFLRFGIIGKFGQACYWGGGLYPTFLTMAKGIIHYIKLLIFPLRLCADYSNMQAVNSIFSPGALVSIILLSALFISAVYLKKHSKSASFFGLWFFVTILPVSNIIPINIIIAERFLYLPSIGFCVLLSMFLVRMYNLKKYTPAFFKYFSVFIAILIISLYSVRTHLRNKVWLDEEIFFGHILEYDPQTVRALNNLSSFYLDRGKVDQAIPMLKKAVYLSPTFVIARDNLALAYFAKGSYEEAIKELDSILKLDAFYARAHEFRGLIHTLNKEFDKAILEYKKALAVDPGYLYAYYDIGRIYETKGLYKKALTEYENILDEKEAFHFRVFLAIVNLRIAELYHILGEQESAFSKWRGIMREFPDQAWAVRLSQFSMDQVPLEELEKEIEDWQPSLKVVGLYYMGYKSEIRGDYKGAKKFYKKSGEIYIEGLGHARLLETGRLKILEKQK